MRRGIKGVIEGLSIDVRYSYRIFVFKCSGGVFSGVVSRFFCFIVGLFLKVVVFYVFLVLFIFRL